MAIGARPGVVVGMVLRQGLTLAGAGLLVGALFGAIATRVVAGTLYGVSGADPVAWGSAAAVLLGAALAANIVPAWRAVQIDPVRALRN
jgi:ABC-type antimicrobial peptide transport system permease subunit